MGQGLAVLTELPDDTFAGCRKLNEIVLPDSLVQIEDNAFVGYPSQCFVVSPGSTGHLWANRSGRKYRMKQPARGPEEGC